MLCFTVHQTDETDQGAVTPSPDCPNHSASLPGPHWLRTRFKATTSYSQCVAAAVGRP